MTEHLHGPWEYVPGTEHHGPYICGPHGGTVADCYTMTLPNERSTANGGPSKPVPFFHEMAEPNARLIAAAPELLKSLQNLMSTFDMLERNGNRVDPAQVDEARAAIAKATGAK